MEVFIAGAVVVRTRATRYSHFNFGLNPAFSLFSLPSVGYATLFHHSSYNAGGSRKHAARTLRTRAIACHHVCTSLFFLQCEYGKHERVIFAMDSSLQEI